MATVTTMADILEDKIITLLSGSSALDEVAMFCRGEPQFIPQQYYPAIIIFVTTQDENPEETGVLNYQYGGVLAVETLLQEELVVTDRIGRVDSYTFVRSYLDAVTDILEANRALGNVSDASGEQSLVIHRRQKNYFLNQRDDALTNRAELVFEIQTNKLES